MDEPIYVVVSDNDIPHPRWGLDPGGPLVHETYTKNATREAALKRAAGMSTWGRCRIARLVFEDDSTPAGHTPAPSTPAQDQR
ncbi:MAG: hypothetical protein HY855_02785 [Burkholderiales bacterium]|nr:hypothetical protein [Burkholderiales bacterium]